MGIAFLGIHIRHRGQHWSKRFGWQRVGGPGTDPGRPARPGTGQGSGTLPTCSTLGGDMGGRNR